MEMNDRFLRACRREPVDVTPVWFMRQAGRYMAEYRLIREKYSLIEICQHPEIVADVTMQPVRALGVDAAILFADILLPVIPLGMGLEFSKGEGPVIGSPVRTLDDVRAMKPFDAESDPRLCDGRHPHPAREIRSCAINWLLWRSIHGRLLHHRRWFVA